jgi:hypothetical protein
VKGAEACMICHRAEGERRKFEALGQSGGKAGRRCGGFAPACCPAQFPFCTVTTSPGCVVEVPAAALIGRSIAPLEPAGRAGTVTLI